MLKNSILTSENFLRRFKIGKTLSILLFIPSLHYSQQLDIHTKRFYESNSQLYVRDIKLTKDNGFVVVGNAQISFGQQNYFGSFIFYNDSSSNISTNSHWEKVFTTFGNVGDFSFEKVEELPDSSFLVSGKMLNVLSNKYGGALLKMDKNGNEIWKKSLETATNDPLIVSDIMVESDSTFMILGSKMNLVDQSYLCKLDTAGNLIWQKSLSIAGSTKLELLAFEKLQNGAIILSGKTYADPMFPHGILILLDSLGNVSWSIQNDQIYSSFTDVITDQNTIYCRNLDSNGSNVNSVSAFDLAGTNLWNYVINGSEMNVSNGRRKIHFDQDSNLVIYYSNFSYGNFHRLTRQGDYIGEFAVLGVSQGIQIDQEDGKVLVLSSGPSFGVKSSMVMNDHFAVTKLDNIQTSQSACIWNYSTLSGQQPATFTSVNLLSGDSCHITDAMMENVAAFITIDNSCVEFLGGLGDDEILDFEVFPNPASDYLDVRLNPNINMDAFSGVILDIYGNELHSFQGSLQDNKINVSNIPFGIYWMKIGDKIKRITII